MSDETAHREKILDQFTRQAAKFQAYHRSAEEAVRVIVEFAAVETNDNVLDVACGPGVLACAFAEVAGHVTGIDITPTMIEHAASLQASKGLKNVTWQIGDVARLPFAEREFSLVVSRYAIHHMEEPLAVVKEMARVCKAGGRVMLIDSAPAGENAQAFNQAERMRDPSHTRALTPQELHDLMHAAGLIVVRAQLYAWEQQARALLDRSFPAPGDAAKLWNLYTGDTGVDRLGMNSRYVDGDLHVSFPTLMLVGEKQK